METTQHTPADYPGGEMSERTMEKARQVVHRLSEWYFAEGGDNDPDSPIDRGDLDALHELVRTAEATLRTPRGEGEGEAQPWRKVGEEPPPNGVQVLAYDPRPDGYSYAGCWAYTLIRKGDQFYLDGERCDEEDRSRLNIEEWLWQPLPPYPGSRSKDDDVRDAALRPEAQGEDRWEDLVFGPITQAYNEAHAARRSDAQEKEDALVCASCGEPIGDEPTVIWQGAYTHYRCTPEDAIQDDTPVIRPIDAARRGEGGGE